MYQDFMRIKILSSNMPDECNLTFPGISDLSGLLLAFQQCLTVCIIVIFMLFGYEKMNHVPKDVNRCNVNNLYNLKVKVLTF